MLPGEGLLTPPEVSVGRCEAVLRLEQIQLLDDRGGPRVKDLVHRPGDFGVGHLARAEGLDEHGHRLRDADGISELHFTTLCEPRGHHVLRHVPGEVAGRAVHLRGVLAREGAATVTGPAAVGVDDDLAAGQAGITQGAARDKTSRGIDVVLHAGRLEPLRDQRLDHLFDDRLLQGAVGDVRRVLGRNNHRVDGHSLTVLVPHRDLGLAVRPQEGQRAVLANLGQPLADLVGQHDGHRHELRSVPTGIAKHHALVARAKVRLVVRAITVDTLGDIQRLLLDGREHRARGKIESQVRMVVPDVLDHAAHDLRQGCPRGGRDLAGDDHKSGLRKGLTRHPASRILLDQAVQNRVRDLIADLVRVPFGHGLRGKQKVAHVGCSLSAVEAGFHRLQQTQLGKCLNSVKPQVLAITGPGLGWGPNAGYAYCSRMDLSWSSRM